MPFDDPNMLRLANLDAVKGAATAVLGHVHGHHHEQSALAPVTQDAHYAAQEGLRALTTLVTPGISEAVQFVSSVDAAVEMADRMRVEAERSRMVTVSVSPAGEQENGKAKAKDGQGASADGPVAEPTAARNLNLQASLRANGRAGGGDTTLDAPAPSPQDPAQEAALRNPVRAQRITTRDGLTLATIKSATEGWLSGNLGKEQEKPKDKAVMLPANTASRTSPPPTPARPQPAGQAPAPRR